ncbi:MULTISPECIES: hypothetical protein [Pseudoalteromonas]|jgi:hypothetical protein|uniref:Uncharacterized protein n=1 Tax=Pseudoalteromonas tetraodonis TaxID=43659 RepID=A0ABD4EK91_9GAMM|nr:MULTISPECIES: hypothetical protein [Pseudoalteromonas]MAY58105.1 hypothetical protein [Pseudoalteromonas sp.]KYL32977.1 hypothetical protein A2I96_16835 [Pseudoalteromonas spiralis]MDN3395222.1 hypothetical protein [Pseudoalteromonas sp. APC 3215]MDN3400006.1 hypothetical protein [Pseudoalteromonas sp. APC 3213]MDN3405558.1 hypothetical protein [Pseudoalteromonas sp. APC 3218]|tara:strand:- start:462 stop:854 length:393 start_codon:yes stop_codon:yes gene_type:complete
MKIKRVFNREGDSPNTTLSWTHEERLVEINFSFDASAVFSKKLNLVFVEAYADMEVQLFKLNGEYIGKYKIATLEHYSFRGLNQNMDSKTGVSLLFHPNTNEVGNEWGDTEQYEFIMGDNTLGKFLDIYR